MSRNTPVSAKATTPRSSTIFIDTPDSAIYIMMSNSAVSTTTPVSVKPASVSTRSTSATSASSAGDVASKQSRKRPRQDDDHEEVTGAEQPAPKKPAHHTCSDLRARITPRVPFTIIKKPTVPAFPDLFGGITPRAPPKIIKKMMPITKEEARRLQRSRDVTAHYRVSKPPSCPARTPSRQTPARPTPTHAISRSPTFTRPTPSSSIKKPTLKLAATKDDEDDEKIIVYNPRPRSKAAMRVKALLEDSDDDLITSSKPTSSRSTKAISVDSAKSKVHSTATTTGDEEDADYQYALSLHAELNGTRSYCRKR